MEESYMDLSEEMGIAHPPKEEPHTEMAHTTKRPTAPCDERVLQQLWGEPFFRDQAWLCGVSGGLPVKA